MHVGDLLSCMALREIKILINIDSEKSPVSDANPVRLRFNVTEY